THASPTRQLPSDCLDSAPPPRQSHPPKSQTHSPETVSSFLPSSQLRTTAHFPVATSISTSLRSPQHPGGTSRSPFVSSSCSESEKNRNSRPVNRSPLMPNRYLRTLTPLIAFVALAITAAIPPAQAQAPAAAPASAAKHRVAVMNFDYGTVQSSVSAIFGTDQDIGKGISAMRSEEHS